MDFEYVAPENINNKVLITMEYVFSGIGTE